MALPDYFLQELKSRANISEIISSYVELKRRGKNFVGLCPFHGEKTPSFSVNNENGFFYCFGCGVGGDVITFIMKRENLDYIEAIKLLCEKTGLQMPESGMDDSMSRLRARVLEINRETARFFHATLMKEEGKAALDYLLKRGIDIKTIKHFGLGFASENRFSLVNYLKAKGYKNSEIESANVAFLSKNGNPIDRFNNRVMFPIIDLRGNVVAFGGRIMSDEKPKYINSSDTPVYHKSSGLFAMNFAKDSKEQFILAEGYMDVISLHKAGFTGAVASLGTALTKEQAKIISRYTNDIVICYDSDEAGRKATERAMPILRDEGLLVRVLTIPGKKDPDEFINSNPKDGVARFKALLNNCSNDIEYRMEKIKSECDLETNQGKIDYLTRCSAVLSEIENSIERDVYAGKLSAEIMVEKSAINSQIEKQVKQKRKNYIKEKEKREYKIINSDASKVNPDKAKNIKIANAEEALIAYMLRNPDGRDYIKDKISPEDFFTAFGKRVYNVILGKNIQSQEISLTDMYDDFTEQELSFLSRILYKYSEMPLNKSDSDEYIGIIKGEGKFANPENIKKADNDELADYFKALKNKKS